MTNWDKLVSGDDLEETAKSRKLPVIKAVVPKDDIQSKLADGWSIVKEYAKHNALMEKPKSVGDAFEDEVWMIFERMGFKTMNADRSFKISYSGTSHKQIDVVAIDDEVCLLIECKATAKEERNKDWKTDLEAIKGFREDLFAEIRSKFPNRKCKYIFATKNYVIGDQDQKRMADFQIANFDYDTLQYYKQLVDHLGNAAKYQLLGSLFARQKIEQLDGKVAAIRGEMGNLTYYSFLIEPERLLKIAYVLHMSRANRLAMASYQRLIKKERLKAIRKFVNAGGYFPNSLIVSIDAGKNGVRFDLVKGKKGNIGSGRADLGILHLPNMYQSVYVIDGQHRLYGYSETEWASKNSIPVVAFVNLPKDDQVKMFMDINQNQKAVSKSLRNTLNIDLLWNSESCSKRLEALMLRIGEQFGDDHKSPLNGRVVIGEDATSVKKCITLEYIKEALKHSGFFNTYKNDNTITSIGTFEKSDNDSTFNSIYPFLVKCFQYLKDHCADEWNKGQQGFLTINNCIYAIICIFGDIVNIVLSKEGKDKVPDGSAFAQECRPFLKALADTINSLDGATKNVIKTSKGGNAKKESWRKLQAAFHEKYPDFTNAELEKYIVENCGNYDEESKEYLEKILVSLKKNLWEAFPNKKDWRTKYISPELKSSLVALAAIKSDEKGISIVSHEETDWEFVSYKEIASIIAYGTNWSTFASKVFVRKGTSISKNDALSLVNDLNSFQNKLSSAKHVTFSQLETIKKAFEDYVHSDVTSAEEE